MKQPYGVQKIVHHPAALDALRHRKPQPPIQIHFMPALACNQSCAFCLVAGTMIATPAGSRAVEDLRPGDEVQVGDQIFKVTANGSRWADNLRELRVGDNVVRVTGEHPAFSQRGFVEVDATSSGDWLATALSLRVRHEGESVCSRPEMALEEDRTRPCDAEAATTVGTDWTAEGNHVLFRGRIVRGLRFEQVVSIRPIHGRFRVYNISVEGAEAYVANGVLLHNCAYGHRKDDDGPEQFGWKNMELMSDAFMPEDKMIECIESWKLLGVKCVEVTGGGEPLIYPHIDVFFILTAAWGVDIGLVTNGTALTEERADLFNRCHWKWARVSIDAGSQESYCKTRRVPPSHWNKAWDAVRRLSCRRTDQEQRVGVGYVVDQGNWMDIYAGCKLAKECGADNVRISAAFTPHHLSRFPEGAIVEATEQARRAKSDLEDDSFQVNNLFDERIANLASPCQDYEFCGTKEVLCVVGGDQNVYTCCTLAFNRKGLIGSIKDRSFKDLWESDLKKKFFAGHDARRICNMECLYEKRNKRMLELIGADSDELDQIRESDQSIHINFI